MVVHSRDICITPGGSPVTIYLSKNDTNFRLSLYLYNVIGDFQIQNGSTVTLEGHHVKDGSTFSIPGTISGKNVTINGNTQITSVDGDAIAEVIISYDGKRLSSANFILAIEPEA